MLHKMLTVLSLFCQPIHGVHMIPSPPPSYTPIGQPAPLSMQLLSAHLFRHRNIGTRINIRPAPVPVSRSRVTTIAIAFKTFSCSANPMSQVSLATSWINEYAYCLQKKQNEYAYLNGPNPIMILSYWCFVGPNYLFLLKSTDQKTCLHADLLTPFSK